MRLSPYRFKLSLALTALLALFLISCGSSTRGGSPTASRGIQNQWPHETGHIDPDPDLAFGKLPNGFRYVLLKNRTPKDRVSMHLMVEAGSVHETDAQQGFAHFLEHMLFNGSTHFPPGELVKYFQRIGMDFGPDANASTGFYHTKYDILLPDGKPESIAEGLLVLGDYAEGALLLETEVERERKVILAEMRTRDSAEFRTFVETLKFELPNDRISQRIPIGTKETILSADRALLKDFYDTWYRPERMILVMVGDFDPDAVDPMIREEFAGMTPRAPARPEPDMGEVRHSGIRPFYHFEGEAGDTDTTLQVIQNIPLEPDSVDRGRRELTLDIANQIVQNRLDRIIRQPDTPFTSAAAASEIYPPHVFYTYITAQSRPENWERTLSVLDRTLRQALEHPFTEAELSRVKKDFLAALDKAVKNASTRESPMLARRLMGKLGMNRVFQSPEQQRDLYAPFIEALTGEAVHDAFKSAWAPDHRLVMVSGNARISEASNDPESLILSAYQSSVETPVSAPETQAVATFPYLDPPENTARIVRREEIPDLGITRIDFANGVRLNLKPTTFKANEVTANLNFGRGRSAEPADKPGLAQISEAVVNESGLGALNRDDLEQALAGKNTAVRLNISDEAFAFQTKSVTTEMPLMFQLLHARLVDPGFRETAFALTLERYRQTYEALSQTVEGAMRLWGPRFLAGGDTRFGLAAYDDVSRLTLGDVEAWLREALENAPLELSIVGDFKTADALELASAYFGSLPARKVDTPEGPAGTIAFPKGKTLEIPVRTRIDKGLIQVAYPTDDIWDIEKTRRLSILSAVFSDRMREVIREQMGASYNQDAYNVPSRAYPGYGVMSAVIGVKPDDAEKVVRAVKDIASAIVRQGVTDDELRRALDPTLTGIKDLQQENGYWLNTVLAGSRKHPEQIAWSRTMIEDYAAITREQLRQLARRYLDNAAAAIVIIRPTIGAGGQPEDQKAG